MDNLQFLVENYETPARAKNLVAGMKIALVAGIAAAGKDSILREILVDKAHFSRIITTIPRAPRPGEIRDVSYHFIDENQVRKNLAEHAYFETKMVHGRVYGTTIAELERIHGDGKIAIGDVDVQGVAEYQRVLGENLRAIFVVPPSFDIWQERWNGRNDSESPTEKARRMLSAKNELAAALDEKYYRVVVNDDLARAADTARKIILEPDFAKNYDDAPARKIARELHDRIAVAFG